jgi:hypothetical protein
VLTERVVSALEVLKRWERRGMFPWIVVPYEVVENRWGYFLRVETVRGRNAKWKTLLLFFGEFRPQQSLYTPIFLYACNNPIPVKFELIPCPDVWREC